MSILNLMTDVGVANFRVTARNGLPVDLSWATGIVVPSGVSIDCIDLGWRVDIQARRLEEEVTVIGDLRTSERVVLGDEDAPLLEYALLVMEQRLRAPWLGRREAGESPSTLQLLARSSGAKWLPPLDR
jgi:hypothetical protein